MDQSARILAVLAVIVVAGIAIQWVAWRIRLPAIVLLMTAGILLGPASDVVDPQTLFGDLLLPVVSLCVGLILFEGGLNLRLDELRENWRSLVGLLTVGVGVTWCGTTLAAWWWLGFPPAVAWVVGAVLVVTGPTVIGPLLREIRPTGRVGTVAKWEGIAVDPVGAALAVLVFEAADAIQQAEYGSASLSAATGLTITILAGLVVGLTAAGLLVLGLARFWIPDFLQSPVTLMLVIASFAVGNTLHHEAGLLAVTVLGVALANQPYASVQRIVEFKESLTIVLISALFVVLSARMTLESIVSVGWGAVWFALTLVLVVRPLAVGISTVGSQLTWAERGFLSWFAPRGIVAAAVSSVFALRMGDSGAALAPVTFVVILVTVTVYGFSAGLVARRLGLSVANAQGILIAGANQAARAIALTLSREGFHVELVDSRFTRVGKARREGLSARFANILSEHVLDDVDFSGIGRFLAMTSNDEVNALAAARFRDLFGRENVYRLASGEVRGPRRESHYPDAGRILFGPYLTYERIDTALDQGARIKLTQITESFSFADFQAHYRDRACPLFLVEGQRLTVIAADTRLAIQPGQALVSLVLPESAGPNDSREPHITRADGRAPGLTG